MKVKMACFLSALLGASMIVSAEVLRVVHEPRQVSSVSTKTERGWVKCRYCGSKIGYDRTFRWDPYDRVWNETTKEVPDTCRKCKSRDKEFERLQREENDLDRRIELKEAKKRVSEKRERLRNWSSENR